MGQHILVPIDWSSKSEKAFAYALKERPESRITLLHVINPVSVFGYADEDSIDLEGYRNEEQRRREYADQMFEEYRDKATARGIDVETITTTGKPARKILEAAENHEIDQIVMGSTGRSGVGRVLFGSVAETVTRRSTVPVTIVR